MEEPVTEALLLSSVLAATRPSVGAFGTPLYINGSSTLAIAFKPRQQVESLKDKTQSVGFVYGQGLCRPFRSLAILSRRYEAFSWLIEASQYVHEGGLA